MKTLIKLLFVLGSIVIAYIVIANTTNISIFKSGEKSEKRKFFNELTHKDFLKSLPQLNNVTRFGGGNVVMFYDSVQHKTLLQSCYFSKENAIQLDRLHFQNIMNSTTDLEYFFQTPFPFEKFDEKSKKFGSALFNRGFYSGIYRELLENIVLWQQKYGNLIISFGMSTDTITKSENVLVFIETKINGKIESIAYSMPNAKSKKHIYDYMIVNQSMVPREQLDILNALKYTYPNYNTAIKTWKINSKKYELRNLKWNFD